MLFPGIPLAGRAVVNGASEAVPPCASIPDAKPGLPATIAGRAACRAVACAGIPAKGRRM
ncbi:hypothetical protein ACLB1M_34870 [Escherichia coli]